MCVCVCAGDPKCQFPGSTDGKRVHLRSSKPRPPPHLTTPPLSPQPCEELSLALLDVLDDFVNCDILNRVRSGHHGNRRPSYLDVDDDEDWDEYVPAIEYQVSHICEYIE